MMKWNKATSKEKLMAIMAFVVFLIVCFVLIFEIPGKEGR